MITVRMVLTVSTTIVNLTKSAQTTLIVMKDSPIFVTWETTLTPPATTVKMGNVSQDVKQMTTVPMVILVTYLITSVVHLRAVSSLTPSQFVPRQAVLTVPVRVLYFLSEERQTNLSLMESLAPQESSTTRPKLTSMGQAAALLGLMELLMESRMILNKQ